MRKIYIVPNIVTTANMGCGFFSIIASIHREFVSASWAILAAAVFDMLDGRIARLAKATSRFGVEYDSLSDLLSFGMAPAILLYLSALEPFGRLGWLAAFLFVACGALRLARFNVMVETSPKNYFMGLPIPMGAGMVATFMIFANAMDLAKAPSPEGESLRQIFILLLTFGLASLMVSMVRFPSFKELNWRSKTSFGYLLIGVLIMILIAVRPEITLFLMAITYVGSSLVWNLWLLSKRASRRRELLAGHPAGYVAAPPPAKHGEGLDENGEEDEL